VRATRLLLLKVEMFPSPEMSTILSENKNSPKEEKKKKISNIV
jgi:hypothetical protein